MIKSFLKYAIALSLFKLYHHFSASCIGRNGSYFSKTRTKSIRCAFALQAFSGDMLEDAGVRDTNDLTNMIPDMMMSGEDPSRANIWLRGIGSTKFDIGSESSNAFVDEVYMPRHQSVMSGLVDIERIEILKGPQGTLYGRNALGGAVSIFIKNPQANLNKKLKLVQATQAMSHLAICFLEN